MTEDKDLQYHKEITELSNYTQKYKEQMDKLVESFFIEMKTNKLNTNQQMSIYYSLTLDYFRTFKVMCEILGVELRELIEADKVQESKEITELEQQFGDNNNGRNM